jgi:hypothetical protein
MITYPAITMDELVKEDAELDNIIENRIRAEQERLKKREEDFWQEVGKHVHISTDIREVDFEPSADAQIISKFSDIKIGFKRG